MSDAKFQFASVLHQTRSLEGQLKRALHASEDDKVRALVADLNQLSTGLGVDDRVPLTVAFVGQYDAGKSTMITSMTGRTDIPIEADVCTNEVTAYDWQGIHLLDTPGIHAGHPDHDELTYAAMDEADLLVFVITNELFDDIVGEHFRTLAYKRSKAREIMLVVNKMAQDPGTPDDKRADLEKVTDPLELADFRTVFIDALAYLEAKEEEDDEDRQDLLEIANFDSFTSGLNSFVRDQGLLARLTTPLFSLRAIAEQARSYVSVQFPEERAALELLHRKRLILLESSSRLRSEMQGLLDAATSDIVEMGDQVAEQIEPGSTESQVKASHATAQEKATARCMRLARDGEQCILQEMERLHQQLDALGKSVLAAQLQRNMTRLLADGQHPEDDPYGSESDTDWKPKTAPTLDSWPSQAKRIGGIAKSIGNQATSWSTGPFAATAKLGSATAARGSAMHRVVYDVGKFFGVKFKPWGAVNVARYIGNAGRVISAAAGILGVVAQIAEDHQHEQQRLELRRARVAVRDAYHASADEVRAAFTRQLKGFEATFYGNELAAVNEAAKGLAQRRDTRSREQDLFNEICREATGLIEVVQTS